MEGTEMLEDLFREIAIEAIAPRKSLFFQTSEFKTIRATPLTETSTKWELQYYAHKKSFISNEGLDEIGYILVTMCDFFNQDWVR
jgi:hypothetical protein